MPLATPPQVIHGQISYPPTLTTFTVPATVFLQRLSASETSSAPLNPPEPPPATTPTSQNPHSKHADLVPQAVAVGAFIFADRVPEPNSSCIVSVNAIATTKPRLLIVRRVFKANAIKPSPLDGKWEVPGGGVDDSDASILEAVAREVKEETGLSVTRVLGLVGRAEGERFESRRGLRVVKVNFEVEVRWESAEGVTGGGSVEGVVDVEDVAVRLARDEHQAFAWVGQDELGEVDWAHTTSQNLVVAAFSSRARRSEQQALGRR